MSQGKPSDKEIGAYCQAWMVNGNDQSAAWRQAYPASKGSAKNVHEKASKMHKSAKVQQRIAELQAITAELADKVYGITAESLVRRLAELDSEAAQEGKYTASVSAVMGQAKLCGFDTQKIEMELTGDISVSDRMMVAKNKARDAMKGIH